MIGQSSIRIYTFPCVQPSTSISLPTWVVRKAHSSSYLPCKNHPVFTPQEIPLVDTSAFLLFAPTVYVFTAQNPYPRCPVYFLHPLIWNLFISLIYFISEIRCIELTEVEFLSIQLQCLLCPLDSALHVHCLLL